MIAYSSRKSETIHCIQVWKGAFIVDVCMWLLPPRGKLNVPCTQRAPTCMHEEPFKPRHAFFYKPTLHAWYCL